MYSMCLVCVLSAYCLVRARAWCVVCVYGNVCVRICARVPTLQVNYEAAQCVFFMLMGFVAILTVSCVYSDYSARARHGDQEQHDHH